ncbi:MULTISPECIES: AAA family ATPase [unclassified Mycolicibacterium]|uniref:AAA family ATPase n=1 Tax=unclassified Mycolicibacterium TaxID=2636767 RepID=UPI001307476F|nr:MULTISPECIES: AAA family ATPase [unclassified Mycolicibacterium]MUL84880.1 AAA family ATPase [Mycolicibacterium sp. CBMA 329]MUL90847.1 AAA family ATPase [Mycolicibacterium sp. CBMA 331]MUM01795.1 AAA family ATPase [Mycolicibacterium sp. CBMA 334]MUM40606.1 AAA family ATPase [Mycolicibacterium sp. CBMA 247]MUM46802.1 AAA family ATPase [Mycolicibacterium sp. CBMA 294]
MKLHRLVLTNYRGITHREIEFPDHGVVVVSGANEIGKSSMIEALDLLLEAKDRSGKKEVKQVKPTHADVGAEVTAEISTGPYRFTYRKRFHKRAETQLTVLAPVREQLSGDEAHERVLAMLGETVDTSLWQAQRVLQASSTAPVDLSGSDALARALDVAAGEAVALSGDEPLLIERIDAEYLRYFTATGRPTGEWAAVTKRLAAADDTVARCAAAVAEVDDAVRRHAELSVEVTGLAGEREQAQAGLAAARTAAEAVAALVQRLKEAEVVAEAARVAQAASAAALTERRRLRAELDERAATITELQAALSVADGETTTAREVHEAAEAAAEQARVAADQHAARVEAARATLARMTDREEADRLATRLSKIDAAVRELDRVNRELAGITIDDAGMRAIEAAAVAVERAAGQAELASARIELVAVDDLDVRVDETQVALEAGRQWSVNTTADTEIDVPGVLTVRVVPGTPAAQTQARLDAAQTSLTAALAGAGVDDVDAARALDCSRRELIGSRGRLRATVEALTGEDRLADLRSRLAQLRAGQPDAAGLFELAGPADTATARTELDSAVGVHRQAVADSETSRKVIAAAAQRLSEKSTRVSVLREKLTTAQAELTVAGGRLEVQRAQTGDDELAVKAQAADEEATATAGRVAALRTELSSTAPDSVKATLAEAARCAELLGVRHDAAVEGLREVAAQLKVYGTQGRKGHLDAAETEREHAHAEYLRVHRRARASETLRSVMARHRDATRRRYADPFRLEVQRLGRLVFGEDFEVDVDSDLNIRTRTLSGRTVPYESLSGGAKEQLAIVARLAGATMVAKEDSVPVIIDDALGFTDPDRLTKMGTVFDAVGGDGQVIVLTCSPERYASVQGAHHIALTA